MQNGKKNKKAQYGLLILGVILFGLVVTGVFLEYRRSLECEFNHLVAENLSAYTESQKREVLAYLDDVRGTVDNMAILLSRADQDPEGQWTADYFHSISEAPRHYNLSYISMESMENNLDSEASEDDAAVVQSLRAGQTVLSDVHHSTRFGGYFFSIAAPVIRDGVTIGAVRSVIPAERLVQNSQTGYLRQSITSYVIKDNGDFVCLRREAVCGENLFERGELQEEAQQQALRENLRTEGSATTRVQVAGQKIFISSSGLGYHGWKIVNFANADDVTDHAQNILRDTALMSVLLILFTVLLLAMVFIAVSRQSRALHLSEKRYHLLARFSDTLLFEYNYRTDTIDWSENAVKVLDIAQTHIERYMQDNRMEAHVYRDDLDKVRRAMESRLRENEEGSLEMRLRTTDAAYRFYACQYQTLYTGGIPVLMIGKLSDISAHKKREQHLQARAAEDPLTGLLNAAALRAQVRTRLKRGENGFLFLLDVDDFKSINDRHGHVAGDAALHCIASALRQVFRTEDPVGRLGGDEFAAFMTGASNREAAKEKARRLLTAISESRVSEAPELRLAVSIGIACAQDGAEDIRGLTEKADRAMYAAKRAGKNQYHLAEDEICGDIQQAENR